MNWPGKIANLILRSLFKKPATLNYPARRPAMAAGFRGKIKFIPKNCIGCKMCVRDCPSGAIEIRKTGEKQFEAEFDLGKCIYCAQCVDSCLKKALEITDEFDLANLDRDKLKVIFRAETQDNPQK